MNLPALLLVVALPVTAGAQFTCATNHGAITIVKYTGSSNAVVIPASFNGLPVTTIGDEAFYSCTNLISVTLPNSVTTIGYGAFWGCSSLASVTIGGGVTDSLEWAFSDCASLAAITVDVSNPSYSSLDGVLFDKSQTTLIQCPPGKAGHVTIPNTVTTIGDMGFYSCASLTSVTVGSGVTNNLEWAFFDCTSLTAIAVDVSNPSYGSVDGVLFDKARTTLIRCPKGKAGNVTIPGTVANIGNMAFSDCASLASVTIPNSVTRIGNGAFSGCSSLASVNIPGSVIDVGGQSGEEFGAFSYCASLASVTIGGGVTTIGHWMFYGCANLTNVTIPAGVIAIGEAAFSGCSSLSRVDIPRSVTGIGANAFASCASLMGAYFSGNAPGVVGLAFNGSDRTTVYYLPGTRGWGPMFGGRPTIMLQNGTLLIRSVGAGTLNPDYGNAVLQFGLGYTITATPVSGHKFSQWQVTTNWQKPAMVVLTNKLNFTMQPDLTLTAVFLDADRPTVTVTNLGAGQRFSNAVYTVSGAASDNVAVSTVWYRLNSGSWTLASGTNPWTAPLQWEQRTNTLQVYAQDTAGNCSMTSSVPFLFVQSAPLLVRTLGLGTLSPNYGGTLLELGLGYTITATPTNGHTFGQWQVTTNWASPPLVVLTNQLDFTMQSNLTLTAVFLDTNRPAVTAANLVAGQRISNGVYTVTGAASDNVAVSTVWYRLNAGSWTPASGTNPWTAPLPLEQRTNTFQVYARDAAGNCSMTSSVPFLFVQSAPLLVRSLGLGTLSPSYGNTLLELGLGYTITATPTNGHTFGQWQVTTNWASPPLVVLTNQLDFTMQSNLTLTAVFLDTNRPTVTVTNLVAGQRISNAVFTVKGAAGDNVGPSKVWSRLNSAPAWTLAAGTNPWAAPLQLQQRTNTFQAYAEDAAGNRSATSSVTFICILTAPMTVRITGKGTVNSNYNGKWLEIGKRYSMTASSGTGYALTNWTDGEAIVVTNKATVSFLMSSNLVLQANFRDAQKPVVAITAPAAAARIGNAVVTVRGTVSDNGPLGLLWHQYAGGAWKSLSADGTNWSVGLLLHSGTNSFRIYAVDAAGNISLTAARNLVCTLPSSALTNAFRITALSRTNTGWQLRISDGRWGTSQVVQGSSNLVNWTAIFTNSSTNSRLEFMDPEATKAPRRFYRLAIP